MRPVDQVVEQLKKAEETQKAAEAATKKLRDELETIYKAVSDALGKKPTAGQFYRDTPPV